MANYTIKVSGKQMYCFEDSCVWYTCFGFQLISAAQSWTKYGNLILMLEKEWPPRRPYDCPHKLYLDMCTKSSCLTYCAAMAVTIRLYAGFCYVSQVLDGQIMVNPIHWNQTSMKDSCWQELRTSTMISLSRFFLPLYLWHIRPQIQNIMKTTM